MLPMRDQLRADLNLIVAWDNLEVRDKELKVKGTSLIIAFIDDN
jgi:hypothetical protein